MGKRSLQVTDYEKEAPEGKDEESVNKKGKEKKKKSMKKEKKDEASCYNDLHLGHVSKSRCTKT